MRTTTYATVKFSKDMLADIKKARKTTHKKWCPAMDKFIVEHFGKINSTDFLTIAKKNFGETYTYRSVYDRKKLLEQA